MSLRDFFEAHGNDMAAYDNGAKWRKNGYTGPLNDAGDPAQKEDCDPRVWSALTTGDGKKHGKR